MDEAVEMAHSAGSAAERVLLSTGAITEEQLARAVAERFGLDHLDLQPTASTPTPPSSSRPAAIKRYQAVPVSFANDRTLLVAMADPANVLAVDDIAVMTGYEVRPAVASPSDIDVRPRAHRRPELGRRQRRRAARSTRSRRRRAEAPPGRPGGPLYDLTPADRQLRRVGRGRLGHPARAARDLRGRRARLLRHPLRAARGGDAGPLPHRRRPPGGGDRPGIA